MVCLLCSKLAGHKQNEVLLSCYLYYYSLVFERLSWRLEVPREKPFCASSFFSIIICSFALCVPCNSLHCLNEAIFSTLFFFSPLLWTIRRCPIISHTGQIVYHQQSYLILFIINLFISYQIINSGCNISYFYVNLGNQGSYLIQFISVPFHAWSKP